MINISENLKNQANPHHEVDFDTFKNALTALRNPKGNPIFPKRDDGLIQKYWNLNVNLDKLLKLFSYTSSQDYESFFPGFTIDYLEKDGYSVCDLIKLAELRGNNGIRIVNSSADLDEFVKIQGKIEEVEAIIQVKDSVGNTIYRRGSSWGGFDGICAITNLLKVGGNAIILNKLTNILDDDKESVFKSPAHINRLLEHQGTVDYAQSLINIKDHNGIHIFDERSISLFKQYQGTLEYAERLTSIKDTNGKVVFSSGEDVVDFYHKGQEWEYDHYRYFTRDIETAEQFVELKDSEGKTVFRDGKDIVIYLQKGGSIEDAKKYLSILDQSGKTYFKGFEIALLKENNVPVEYASEMAKQSVNAMTIIYHYRTGFEKLTHFKENKKPKALILYPTDNPQDFFGGRAFSVENTFDFFKEIDKTYDMKLRAISTTNEMAAELEATTDVKFLVLGGHGTQTSLTLGANSPKYDVRLDETICKLSPQTSNLQKHLGNLASDAVIFLDSCCNGQGKEDELNMANYVAHSAPGRTVISSTDIFGAGKVRIKRVFPFDAEIYACYKYTECTYIVQK